ncbi:metalloprotease MEP2 [Rhizoctonia solani AG-1 IA]|uniref:Extracellular metalloproteinase n=1 Tax=Thanatephorus cucumeris (strain AG1-IA) TaxID=983506 RepID=L8WKX9_THACA|nr:metalloprotease MEP2 [Rhizoctonia solani AG-1 IA]
MALIRVLASIALMIASGVVAAPWDVTSRHTTHRVRSVGPSKVKLTSYHPPATFEAYGVEGVAHPLAKRGVTDASSAEAAKSFLEDKLGVKADALSHKGGHASEATSFEYFRQSLNGIPVANAVANVALKGDKVTSFGASFVNVAAAEPKLTKEDAISKAESTTGAKYNDWPTSLEYFAKDSDHVVLAHVVQVQNAETSEWYEIFVDANSGEVVNVIDFVSDASYRVVPLNVQDPEKGYSVQTDPADTTASPNGWHQTGSTTTSNTSGNNVISYKAILLIGTAGTSSQSSATNNYDYAYNSAVSPTTSPNVDAARVNYKYGFTEAAYNFQNDNYGKGGTGNDRVKISVQDWTGSNNANFATPADGQSGQMRMYTWTYTTPNRDGALENDIVVHEYGHGVSNRLTGGGTGRCLQTTEAGGMGEGWSDALAGMTEINSAKLDDFTLGAFVTGIAGGIRSYPYSTSKTTNPLTYGSLATLNEGVFDPVHDIGEVWALIWHEITASLLSKYGYTADKFDSEGTGGNIKAIPTFLTARDADADKYGGENKCLLWQAFAKRGLGSGNRQHSSSIGLLDLAGPDRFYEGQMAKSVSSSES